MYQLEKISLLFDVCRQIFVCGEYDYFAFEIIENKNDFMCCDAKFTVTYESDIYVFVFDDENEYITVYKNDKEYALYSIEYKNSQSYVEKLAQYEV